MANIALNPPHPSRTEEYNNAGQQLQGILKALEKPEISNSDNEKDSSKKKTNLRQDKEVKAAIALLQLLIHSISRHGLLRGDEELAVHLMASSTGADNHKNKKRTKSPQRSSAGLTIHDGGGAESLSSTPGSTNNAHWIVTCVIRILGGQQQQTQPTETETRVSLFSKCLSTLDHEDQYLMIWLASDLCLASCDFVQTHQSSTCAAAEFELLSSNAKLLLTGLTRVMEDILATSCSGGGSKEATFPIHMEVEDLPRLALRSCQKASTCLVSLLGTRLSRHGTQIEQLTKCGVWKSIANVMDSEIVESAAALFAAIPLSGAATRRADPSSGPMATSSEQWSKALKEVVAMAFVLLQSAAPVNQSLADRAHHHDALLQSNTTNRDMLGAWLQQIGVAESEQEKSHIFLHCITSLVSMVAHLLSMETMGCNRLLEAELDILSMLDLMEILMSFPLSAETLYFGIKKRLRREPLDHGQFSPDGMVNMANRIQLLGHRLFKDVLTAVKGPQLLPFARRILNTSHTALLTSSSTAMRNVLEGKVSQDKNRRKWLNASIAVRCEAITSVKQAILTVGLDPCRTRSKSFGIGKRGNGDVDRLVNLVCGQLLEQLQGLTKPLQNTEEWGSFSERMDCLVASAECLGACLVSGGPFLSNEARTLIDSVAKTFISKCSTLPQDRISELAPVCCCALTLGSQACTTPWVDGGLSSLGPCLRNLAQQLQQTSDSETVQRTALSALRVCNSLDTPRVPALTFVTRTPARTATGFTEASLFASRLEETALLFKPQRTKHADTDQKEAKKRKTESGSDPQSTDEAAKRSVGLKDPPQEPKASPSPPLTKDAAEAVPSGASTTTKQQSAASAPEPRPSVAVVGNPNSPPKSADSNESMDPEPPTPFKTSGDEKAATDDDSDDDEMPMIVDAPPDEEDR